MIYINKFVEKPFTNKKECVIIITHVIDSVCGFKTVLSVIHPPHAVSVINKKQR